MTGRVDQIEALGRAVADGLIGQDEAVASLVDWSDGGFTALGAADMLNDWAGARERYAAIRSDVLAALDRIRDGRGGAQ